jgi:hypothetical protein
MAPCFNTPPDTPAFVAPGAATGLVEMNTKTFSFGLSLHTNIFAAHPPRFLSGVFRSMPHRGFSPEFRENPRAPHAAVPSLKASIPIP